MPISEIACLRNLGPKSEAWLNAVGVFTRDDLERVGAVVAFKLVQQHDFAPSINLLSAIEGALRDIHWTDLSPEVRDRLRAAVAD